eukprot:5571515-Pyramimonas_sp.AAC.1
MGLALVPRTFLINRKKCFGRIPDFEGATVTMFRGGEVPGMALWHDSGSSRRNRQVHPWRWNTENNVLAYLRVCRRLFSKEAGPPLERNRCRVL